MHTHTHIHLHYFLETGRHVCSPAALVWHVLMTEVVREKKSFKKENIFFWCLESNKLCSPSKETKTQEDVVNCSNMSLSVRGRQHVGEVSGAAPAAV